ncbi:MAG: MFS transporter [Bacillota bacterium]
MPVSFSQRYLLGLTFLFFCGWVFVYADRTVLYPMLPLIGDSFGLTNAQMGAITSTYFLAYICMQVPAGLLGDRMGLKNILGISVVLAGLALALIGLMSLNYWLLLVLIGLHGLAAGVYYANVYGAAIYIIPEKNRSLYTAIINGGMSVGLILGLLVAGPLYLRTGNWRFPFLVLSVPTVSLGLYYLYYLKNITTKKVGFTGIYNLVRNKNVVLIWIVVMCLAYGYWMVLTWGPTFFKAERGLGLTMSGVYTAIPALAALPSSLILAKLSGKMGKKRIILIFSVLCSLAIFLIAYVQSLTALVLALIAYGICGKLALDPVIISWYGDHALKSSPYSMASAMGLLNFATMLTAAVAPVVCGWVRDLTNSLEGAFYFGAFIVFISFVVAFFIEDTGKPKKD